VTERIAKLKEAVETMHRCKAVHVGSEPVIELFQGQVAWDGVVEIFDLNGHPKAKRCYAWSYLENDEPHDRSRNSPCGFSRDRRQSGNC
jgi:hypothetical protein